MVQKCKSKEHTQMQFCTAIMEYEKRSVTKSVNILDSAMKIVRTYTGKRLSKPFEVSFWSFSGLFCCIKAISDVSSLIMTKEMNKGMVQIDGCKPNTNGEVLWSELICLLTIFYQGSRGGCIAFDIDLFIYLENYFKS